MYFKQYIYMYIHVCTFTSTHVLLTQIQIISYVSPALLTSIINIKTKKTTAYIGGTNGKEKKKEGP